MDAFPLRAFKPVERQFYVHPLTYIILDLFILLRYNPLQSKKNLALSSSDGMKGPSISP